MKKQIECEQLVVPFNSLAEQYGELRPLVDAAVYDVVANSRFIGGKETEDFERWFADYCGSKHAVGVGSGTVALELALRSCGIGPGDDVITVPNTFIATAAAIVSVGARPVFVDVEEQSGTLDPLMIARALTPRVKAILPVHLYGRPANMGEILRLATLRNLAVIEDAAQAHGATYAGARVGSLGVAGCFSFYPSKNLGAFGDGGLVTTNDSRVAETVRLLRDHGRISKYRHALFGFSARLDNLQAAVLRIKGTRLDEWNERRRTIAAWYRELLPSQLAWFDNPGGGCVYHLFVVRVRRRDEFRSHLAEYGVETGVHYPVPLHLQPACADLGYRRGDFPAAERLADEVVSLPMHPFLTRHQIQYVADAASEFFR